MVNRMGPRHVKQNNREFNKLIIRISNHRPFPLNYLRNLLTTRGVFLLSSFATYKSETLDMRQKVNKVLLKQRYYPVLETRLLESICENPTQ